MDDSDFIKSKLKEIEFKIEDIEEKIKPKRAVTRGDPLVQLY